MRYNYAHTAKWHVTTDGHHTLCHPNEADPFNPWNLSAWRDAPGDAEYTVTDVKDLSVVDCGNCLRVMAEPGGRSPGPRPPTRSWPHSPTTSTSSELAAP